MSIITAREGHFLTPYEETDASSIIFGHLPAFFFVLRRGRHLPKHLISLGTFFPGRFKRKFTCRLNYWPSCQRRFYVFIICLGRLSSGVVKKGGGRGEWSMGDPTTIVFVEGEVWICFPSPPLQFFPSHLKSQSRAGRGNNFSFEMKSFSYIFYIVHYFVAKNSVIQ